MFRTVAYYQSIDPAGAWTAINAVPDQSLTVSGTTGLVVPVENQIVLAAAGLEVTAVPYARLTSPSLRVRSLFRLAPFNSGSAAAVKPLDPPCIVDVRDDPVQLVTGETMLAEINSDPAAAQIQWVIVWLADGPIKPQIGPNFTVIGTNTSTLTAGSWTNGTIVFGENLPRGRYQVVGMHAHSAGLVAARLNFVGQAQRPGVLGGTSGAARMWYGFRYGEMGIFGEFEDTLPPTVDFLSVSADTAQTVYLDLIQLRSGPA